MSTATGHEAGSNGLRRAELGWLREQLGIELLGFEEEVIGASRGFISTTWRLRLQSDPPGVPPHSVVLKSETSNAQFRRLARDLRAFEREVRFYRELAPSIDTPLATLYACGNGEDDCWLLMEDLSALRPGDQIRGLSQRQAMTVLKRIAAVHATYWLDPALESHAWLPSHTFWFQGDFADVVEGFEAEYGLRIGERTLALVRQVVEQNDAIDQALRNRPWTLVHGDLRADNLLFGEPGERDEALILDWQTVSRSVGAIDLAFLVGGSEPPAERAGHLFELLELWHGELLTQGVRGYTLADARHDLQLAALRCLTAVLQLYRFSLDPQITVRAAVLNGEAIQRYAGMMEELRAWEALPGGVLP
jgi:aminoglycoside phosphotransferase (APT) family kinase protein